MLCLILAASGAVCRAATPGDIEKMQGARQEVQRVPIPQRLLQGRIPAGQRAVFTNPDHIAILSDKRNEAGIPLLLHNQGPWASEGDDFMAWYTCGIVAHFRFFR